MRSSAMPEDSFVSDERKPVSALYRAFDALAGEGWIKEEIAVSMRGTRAGALELPIPAFRTQKKGDAVWIIAGIHGEEPGRGPTPSPQPWTTSGNWQRTMPLLCCLCAIRLAMPPTGDISICRRGRRGRSRTASAIPTMFCLTGTIPIDRAPRHRRQSRRDPPRQRDSR